MSTDVEQPNLTTSDLEKILASDSELDLKGLLKGIESRLDEKAKQEPVRRTSRRERVALFTESLKEAPEQQIAQIQTIVNTFTTNYLKVMPGSEPRVLKQEEINELSAEYDLYIKLSEALAGFYKRYRQLVNDHLNKLNENSLEVSDRPPAQVKGSLEPDDGGNWRFCREGGDRKDPSVDWRKLRNKLTEEQWAQVTDIVKHRRQIIKAHTTQEPNAAKLMQAVYAGQIPLEDLREALIPGEWQTPKFQVRSIR